MLDLTFVTETLKRRWLIVVLVTAIACVLGLIGMVTQKEEPIAPKYTAEAVLYLNAGDLNEADARYLSQSHAFLANDARRIVLNDSVAGEVRRHFGEDVTLSTPLLQNDLTRAESMTNLIFVDASAPTEAEALDAANMAVELAVERINEQITGVEAKVSEAAAVKTRASGVANYGTDSLTVSPIEQATSSFSFKKLVIFAGVGFILGIAFALLWDYCRRRIRSSHDVERLLGLPVIESIDRQAADRADCFKRGAGLIDALAKKSQTQTICLVGWDAEETPDGIVGSLNSNLSIARIVGWAGLSSPDNDASSLAEADAVVLVIEENAQNARQLDGFVKSVAMLDTPVLGAFFIEK